jgi:hypothetical protein
LTKAERDAYLQEELYIWENFKVCLALLVHCGNCFMNNDPLYILFSLSLSQAWQEEVEEEERRRLAESARYKSYRRYMRKGGPGRITFDDD